PFSAELSGPERWPASRGRLAIGSPRHYLPRTRSGMPSDDTFRKQLQHVIAALETWAKEMEPWADIELGPVDGTWRISAFPYAPTACPFEIILRPDRKFDMMVGGEIYEDQPLDALTDIPQMVRSIANGRVLIR